MNLYTSHSQDVQWDYYDDPFKSNNCSFQCTPSYSSLSITQKTNKKTTTLDFNTENQVLIWIKALDSRMNIYTLVHITMITETS